VRPGTEKGPGEEPAHGAAASTDVQVGHDERIPGLRVSRAVRLWLVGIGVCVAALVLVGALWPTLRHQATLSFTRLPTKYTEMFFTHPNDLPQTLSPEGSPRRVSVTVRNHGAGPGSITYVYDTTLTGDGRVQSLATGRISVPNGRTGRFSVAVKPSDLSSSYVVTISLRGTSDFLRFRASGP
jgi:hypothetical protein